MNILLTGFDPFGGEAVNPAWEAVKQLAGRTISGTLVHTVEIPTVRFKAIACLKDAIAQFDPDVVICVGQAGGSAMLRAERVAINCDDFRIGDNEGHQPIDEPIVPDGPAAYFSTLPIKRIVAAWTSHGVPGKVSNTAGTFVCNHIFYGLMDILAHDPKPRKGGFLHVPYLPEQAAKFADQPSMSLATISKGLELAVAASVADAADVKVTGGELD